MADSAWMVVNEWVQYQILNCGANGEIIAGWSQLRVRYKVYTHQQLIDRFPQLQDYSSGKDLIEIQMSCDDPILYDQDRKAADSLTKLNGYWEFTTALNFKSPGRYYCWIHILFGSVFPVMEMDVFQNKQVISVPPPRISAFSALRCDASGALKADGARAKFVANWIGSSASGNTLTAKIQELVNNTWTTLYTYTDITKNVTVIGSKTYGVDAKPKFRLIIQDKFSPAIAAESILESPSKLMTGDQRSICFGGESSYNGTAEFKMPLWYKNKELIDLLYPINWVVMTYNDVNPGISVGGTWVQIGQGRTLIGAGTFNDVFGSRTFAAGDKGGAYEKYIEPDNLPPHSHGVFYNTKLGNPQDYADAWTLMSYGPSDAAAYSQVGATPDSRLRGKTAGLYTDDGASNTVKIVNHNRLVTIPAYEVVYYWRRTA